MLVAISVWMQAISAGLFLILWLAGVRWWRHLAGQLVTGLTACLFALTLDLAITSSSESLGSVPIVVLIARLGFTLVTMYGTVRLALHGMGDQDVRAKS